MRAWGDPAIVARCGVPAMPPTEEQCVVVDDIGWVDADDPAGPRGELAVGIRSFFATVDPDGVRRLRFGTGAGITWASDPAGEWAECELKADVLVGLASGRVVT